MTTARLSDNASDVRLRLYTRHAVRVLVHLAATSGRLSAISEIAQAYGLSHNHLMKVVHDLRRAGFVESVRGRTGGIRLARHPREIALGDVVRYTEPERPLLADGSREGESLQAAVDAAFGSFFAKLDGIRLSDIAQAEPSRPEVSAKMTRKIIAVPSSGSRAGI